MIRWLTDRPWLLALILIVVVNAPAYAIVDANTRRTDRIVECVSLWGDRVASRTSALSLANDRQRDALDELIRSVGAQSRDVFTDRYNKYIVASDAYKQAQREHPVPVSPRLACE